jgi:hypothetical protein
VVKPPTFPHILWMVPIVNLLVLIMPPNLAGTLSEACSRGSQPGGNNFETPCFEQHRSQDYWGHPLVYVIIMPPFQSLRIVFNRGLLEYL